MALFLSRSTHKVDKKGRVSVPAAFRAALGEEIGKGIALTKPMNRLTCIEASPMARAEERIEQLSHLNPDTADYSAFAMVMLGNMRQVPFDPEGRIVVPADLLAYAGIEDMAVFVGMGRTFQIWQPEALDAYMIEAEELAAKKLDMLHNPTAKRDAAPE